MTTRDSNTTQTPGSTAFNFFVPVSNSIDIIKQQLQPALDAMATDQQRALRGAIICQVNFVNGVLNMMVMRGDYLPPEYARPVQDVIWEYRQAQLRLESEMLLQKYNDVIELEAVRHGKQRPQ